MADDYEDFYDLESMTDEEIEALVREELDEYPDLDVTGIDIVVKDGSVRLAGRIGTDGEAQIIQNVLTDVIGISQVENELVVDALRRIEQPEAADDANAQVFAAGSGRGGADRTEDSAEHMLEDTAAELYGTDDVAEATERGFSYNPPVAPTQEGVHSRENH